MGIKLQLDEFINEVISDLRDCEIEEKELELWKNTFLEMVEKKEISKKNLKSSTKGLVFEVEDEMEIFSITQDYIDALENNDLKTYWNTFK